MRSLSNLLFSTDHLLTFTIVIKKVSITSVIVISAAFQDHLVFLVSMCCQVSTPPLSEKWHSLMIRTFLMPSSSSLIGVTECSPSSTKKTREKVPESLPSPVWTVISYKNPCSSLFPTSGIALHWNRSPPSLSRKKRWQQKGNKNFQPATSYWFSKAEFAIGNSIIRLLLQEKDRRNLDRISASLRSVLNCFSP